MSDGLHAVELREAQEELGARLEAVGPRVIVDLDRCTGCGRCVEICPTDVLRLENNRAHATFESDCCVCFLCQDDCPEEAITINTAMSARGFRSIYDILHIDTTTGA